ncbi:hypothetical protein M1N58_01150 [Dehalococcoidales bacterium]|nr:hypothetical protein [Dehalococcoidales bacterium]
MKEKEAPSLEERVAKVEGVLAEVRARLNHIESEVSQLRQEMNQLRQDMHTQFRWIIGIMLGILIPMWVTIILAIIFAP